MVDRVDGPFEYYQDLHPGVNGDTIRAGAYGPGLHADAIAALASELETDALHTARQVSGAIHNDVVTMPLVSSAAARNLAASSHFAVGLLGSFAGMVDLFDLIVSQLNQDYRSQLADAMRWAGRAAATTADQADDSGVDEAHLGPSIKAYLMPRYRAALTDLDNNADSIAERFAQGPTPDNVTALMRAGLLPLSAAWLYPGVTVDEATRAAYFRALNYLPSAPDPDTPIYPDEDVEAPEVHWWDRVGDALVDAGAWAYNHTIVPGVNTMANIGEAIIEHPEDLFAMLAGAGLMVLGAGGEVGGGLLDATGVGAIVGVPINVASAAVIAAGATVTAAGAADLAMNASQNHNVVLNEASGAGPRPGDSLPSSSRPSTAGSNWEGRVAENGKGTVWQDPASANAPKGSPKNANMFRDADPTPDYPDGYVRYYNDQGQPIGLDGKPGSQAHTHIAKNPDGSYPIPEGWNP